MNLFINWRDAPSTDEQPCVVLDSWRVCRTQEGALHIAAVLQSGSLRLTSPLKHIEPAGRVAVTMSGRRYELKGAPTEDPIAKLMLSAYIGVSLRGQVDDVSVQIWNDCAARLGGTASQ